MKMQLVNEGKKYFEELEMEQVNGREKKKRRGDIKYIIKIPWTAKSISLTKLKKSW